MSSLVESKKSSAFKSFIVTYCLYTLYIFYFSESFRRMSSEVEVDLTICLDIDCWSQFRDKFCFVTTLALQKEEY